MQGERQKCDLVYEKMDPFARPWALGVALLNARRFDEALADVRVRSEAQPNNADLHFLLSDAYLYKKMEKEAEQERQRGLRLSGEQKLADEEQLAYGRSGIKSVLEGNLGVLKQRAAKGYVSPMDLADAYGSLQRKEETLRYLERAYEEHAPWMIQVQSRPHFDFVHSDPRYRAIIKKMNLPPAY